MTTVKREMTVLKIEAEHPHVRVSGYFLEGGTPHQSHRHTPLSFLCNQYSAPNVGDTVKITVTWNT